jgi:hypothetical protein
MISLPALRGDNPLAFLATLGILGLVSDDDPTATLAWQANGLIFSPLLTSSLAATRDELAEFLTNRLDREHGLVRRWLDLGAKDLNVLSVDTLRKRLEVDGDTVGLRIAVSLAAEAPTRKDGRAPLTPFCMAMFNASSGFVQAAVRQAESLREKDIDGCLDWTHRPGVNPLNLDPSARAQVRALMAPDPMDATPSGVPAAVPLAVRGLAFYPLSPRRRGVAPAAFPRGGAFRWPVWSPPLSARAVAPLVAAPLLHDPREPQLAAHGVTAVFEAATEAFMVQRRPLRRLRWGRRVI